MIVVWNMNDENSDLLEKDSLMQLVLLLLCDQEVLNLISLVGLSVLILSHSPSTPSKLMCLIVHKKMIYLLFLRNKVCYNDLLLIWD